MGLQNVKIDSDRKLQGSLRDRLSSLSSLQISAAFPHNFSASFVSAFGGGFIDGQREPKSIEIASNPLLFVLLQKSGLLFGRGRISQVGRDLRTS